LKKVKYSISQIFWTLNPIEMNRIESSSEYALISRVSLYRFKMYSEFDSKVRKIWIFNCFLIFFQYFDVYGICSGGTKTKTIEIRKIRKPKMIINNRFFIRIRFFSGFRYLTQYQCTIFFGHPSEKKFWSQKNVHNISPCFRYSKNCRFLTSPWRLYHNSSDSWYCVTTS
jgi:hypothetical protein